MNKRIISLLLALVMILGLVPGTASNAWAGTMEAVENPFTDVPEGSFYFEPVLWALENGITTGATATTFNPGGVCQRAAVVTFLWRAAGKPEPTVTDNPFEDVKGYDFFYEAVLWAVEKGITNGADATHFNPYGVCNRAQVVTFLHRAKGSPAPANTELPFTDVPAGAWYAAPVAWAVENAVTNGLSATEFGPNAACNRAQVVTFLYRAYSVKEPVCAHDDLQTFEAKAPTCTEPGNAAYWYCADCEKYFSDGDAAAEIAYEDTILAATGHTPGAQATCTKDQTCTVCGEVLAAAIGHVPGAAATCTKDQVCTVCGEVLAAATGHTPGAEATCTKDQVCTVCGWMLKPATGHTEVIDEEVGSTCTKTGLTEGSHCAVCGEVLVAQREVPMADHTPGADATCTEDQVCTACGKVIATMNGHIPGAEATCTEPQRCTVCKTVLAEATGHSLTYVQERDPVSADDPGNRAYWKCAICGKCYLDEAATKEIALADTAWEIYLIYFYDLENNTYTVGAYKQSEALFLDKVFPVEMMGWDFNGWHTSQYFTDENKVLVVPAGNTENLNLYANRSLHEYTITLLGLGREASWTYNIVSGIQLTTPKWKESAGQGDCLIFSHWSDEDGNKITQIPAGEIGDRTIEANWIYKENYAISNPDKYTYVGGAADPDGKYSFIYEIGSIKNIVLSKQHTYPFDGLTEHTESVTKTYSVGESAGQEAARTISEIISSSTEKTDIERHTTTHQEGWEAGAKWSPEVEFKGIKVSAWEFSGGYSDTDTDTYEEAGFSSEKNYEEDGTENEIRTTVDYYTEESESRTVSDTFIPGVTPVGNYTWARLMDVKVYAIVTYNPYTGNYTFDVYSVPTNIHNGLLYTLPGNLEYEVNIVSGDVLDFEIPFEDIPEMFYTVEYDANGGTGEMHKSVHELGVSSKLLSTSYTLNLAGVEKRYGIERAGYTFDRWTTSPDGTGASYTDAFVIRDIAAAGETVRLYAQWTANTYSITYHANGGSLAATNPVTYTTGMEPITLPTPTRTGHSFGGWYSDPACTADTRVGDGGSGFTTTADVDLYAKWTADTVTLNPNGGSVSPQSITMASNGTYAGLNGIKPTRANYAFLGWYYGSTKVTDGMSAVVAGNHTLTAQWTPTYAYVVHSPDTGYPDRAVDDSDKVYDTVVTSLEVAKLQQLGYSKIDVSIDLDVHEKVDGHQEMWLYNKVGGKQLGYNYVSAGDGWTHHTINFTINLADLAVDANGIGSFVVEWGAKDKDSSWFDRSNDWTRGTTTYTITAK